MMKLAKRAAALVLAAVLALSLTACSKEEQEPQGNSKQSDFENGRPAGPA